MKKRFPSIITALLTLALGIATLPLQAGEPLDPLIPGRIIVRLPSGSSISQFIVTLNIDFPGLNASLLESITSRDLHLLQHTPVSGPQLDVLEHALQDTYPAQGVLVYGELVYEGKAPEGSTGSIWVDGPATAALYADQYLVARTNLDSAQKAASGASTVVAVLDTGVDIAHPQLSQRIASGGWNYINNSSDITDVGDALDSDGDGAIDEMVGHGTYVAGLIARTAPEARILPITVLNSDGIGDNWILGKGMFHAIDRGVEVINLSLTSTYDSILVFDAIDEAASRGIVTVAAAGNLNHSSPREYPAMEDDYPVIGVAATDDVDVKGGFSNYNERLYLSAPGTTAYAGGQPIPDRAVVSTLPGTADDGKGHFAISQGTSMATPLVSGTAALIRSQHPEWPASMTTTNAIRDALRTTAVNINPQNPQYAGQLGHGRVNIGAAVALGPPTPAVGDLDNNGRVDADDLIVVILDWGVVHSSADVSGNGVVDVDDLIIVILNWG